MPSREVKVAIIGDPSSLQRALRTSEQGVTSFSSKMQNVGSRLRSVGSSMTRNLTLPLVGFGILAARELSAGETALAQTQAVIESTGSAAGKSVDDILRLSASLSDLTSLDDEPIQQAANTLLTFQNIAGRVFDEATTATLDLSVAMDQDLRSSAVQIGKALNDPIKGLTALQRVGVSFTAQQREAIQAMIYFGDTAGAQRIILQELNAEFGGSAEALGGTTTGRLNRFRNDLESLGASILEDLLPVFEDFVDLIEDLSDAYKELTPNQQKVVAGLIAIAAAAGPLTSVLGLLSSAVGVLFSGVTAVAAALGLSVGVFASVVVAVVGLALWLVWMRDKWDEVSRAAQNAVMNIVNNVPGARTAIDALARASDAVSGVLGTMANMARNAATAVRGIGQGVDFGPLGVGLRAIGSALGTVFGIAADLLSMLQAIASIDPAAALRGLPGVSHVVGESFIPRRNRTPRAGSVAPVSFAEGLAREMSRNPMQVYVVNS